MIIVIEWLTVSHDNVSLHQDSNVNSVRIVNCVTSKCESTAGK